MTQVNSVFYRSWDGKMSTSQRVVMLCGWGVKAGMVCLQIKLCVAISEHFRQCSWYSKALHNVEVYFLATICKTVSSVLSDHFLSISLCLVMLVYCGWMDQDATWYGGKPRPRPHYFRWGTSPLVERGTQHPPRTFRPT